LLPPGSEQPRFAVLFNPDPTPHDFVLPHGPWRQLVDTSAPAAADDVNHFDHTRVAARSLVLLARAAPPGEAP
jgi:hypothetical protein